MEKEKRNLLVFGYGLVVIGLFFAWRLWAKHGLGPAVWIWGTIALAALILTLFNLPALKKVYTVWMKGAGVIGHTVTTVVLTLLFYVVFGIAGIVLRLMGKDLLDQRIEPDRVSYWNPRPAKDFDAESYKRQF